MRDAEHYRDELTDRLMSDDPVAGRTLGEILEQAQISLTFDLTHIFSLPRDQKLDALDNLESDMRKAVSRYVVDHLDDEVSQLMADDRDRSEYEPDRIERIA